jgi:thiol-disulfide isomerase/thioredoxin
MKRSSGHFLFILIVPIFLLVVNACDKMNYEKTEYLNHVLENIKDIESAGYYELKESYIPGDTTPNSVGKIYVREFDNPTDTSIGASYVALNPDDTSKMKWCYDGNIKANVNWEKEYIDIDSFKNNSLPFRPISPPFFDYTESIIQYAMETDDSTSMYLEDQGESVYFKLEIYHNKQVEFIGKPVYVESPYGLMEEVSKYEIWIDKSNDLPYKVNREMSHNRSVNTISNIKISHQSFTDFSAQAYFPDFPRKSELKKNPHTIDMLGKIAPEWKLKDCENHLIGLDDIDSKILVIQFTGIGCGACRASIPFLKQLVTDYKDEQVALVSIETWNSNLDALKRYKKRHDFNFKFLNSTEAVAKKYQISGVPVFFILDENRVIRKIIQGYSKKKTDKKMRDVISEMI